MAQTKGRPKLILGSLTLIMWKKVNIIKAYRLRYYHLLRIKKQHRCDKHIVPMIKSVQVYLDPRPVRVLVYRGKFNDLGLGSRIINIAV